MVATKDSDNDGIGMFVKTLDHAGVYKPAYWEMGISEFGEFLVHWGWVLDVRPPLIDNESWDLMNKFNKKEVKEVQTIEEEQHPLQQLLQALMGRKK